jgi:Holliday junction resolvasome RuvABC endonuclease subunit
MRIIGVDPGCYGALGCLDGSRWHSVIDMPINKIRRGKSDKAEVNGYALAEILRQLSPDVVVLEQVGGMTGQSASAAFNFGRAAGAPEYVAKALGIRVDMVAPITWKKALQVNPGKDGSRAMAQRLWPAMARHFERKKDDGRAEAALIAHWFWLKNGGSDDGVRDLRKDRPVERLHDLRSASDCDDGIFAR